MKFQIVHIVSLLLLLSCTPQSKPLQTAMVLAGSNRSELEKVLAHYSASPSDSLKLRAATFLIENLPWHYYYDGEAVDNYHQLYRIHSTGRYYPEDVLDSVNTKYGAFSYQRADFKRDIETITADYLIENIDWSFKVWEEQPWGESISFEDFCEYVLPYRVGDEQLVSWREKVYKEFNPILDTVRHKPEAKDPLFVTNILLDSIKNRGDYLFSYIFHGPHVGPEIVNLRSGYCRESTDALIYICRALGIPCGRDYMVTRGDDNNGHEWNFILDKEGKSQFGCITYASRVMEPADTYWWKKGKVFRQTFSQNRKLVSRIKNAKEKIPSRFTHAMYVDATPHYTGKYTKEIIIPKEKLFRRPKKNQPIYICLSSRMEWKPVAVAEKGKGGRIICPDMEGDIVYCLATYENGRFLLLCNPFRMGKEEDILYYYHTESELQKVVLLHKYRLAYAYPERVIGGIFEGSNDRNFVKKDTLFTIEQRAVRLWNVADLVNEKEYQYIRYVGPPDSYCNMAEIAFFGNDTIVPLTGKPIGTPNNEEKRETHDYPNLFDGDPNTSFDYYLASGGWAGLDFGKPRNIRRIVYTARNQDNFIRPGNVYELFYNNQGEWVSSGRIEAETDSLVYEVPQTALLYLKNHTTGKDERIFEYKEGEQRFW